MIRTKFLGTPDWKQMFEDAEDKIAELEEELVAKPEIVEIMYDANNLMQKQIAALKKDVAFYRCCALSGEIPDDNQRPSKKDIT